ncbi:NAD(P)-binding domain-containing protein [Fructobacillus sp. CRL 2054]|uniref:pyrroline-5-carboxylate reductase family protein n=1 Tax=Fructobacillus sp. CRL 2054 TaxID=2763007 RepID=UPI002378FAD4|nr:pyrroline-5-carboxylate reductase dimerization domain-containing protein [Fructobacillus sp. CRL 2054]MDD9138882.1 NAD(P)-binding domain-containing protein [Fructobacillus sp. CRL 2054]
MKVGIVGLGHMGSALVKGMVKQDSLKEVEVVALSSNTDKAAKLNISGMSDKAAFAAQDFDILMLTVPAKVTVSVLKGLAEAGLSKRTVVLSAAAGVASEDLEAVTAGNTVFTFIPNIPVAVNAGTIALAKSEKASDEEKQNVHTLLAALGDVVEVKPDQIGIAGVVGGCSPAFIDVLMDAMEDAAVSKGMDRTVAADLIASVVRGTASLAQQSDLSFSDLKGQITSPGGTTIKGVLALEENGFRHAVHEAILSANK